MNIDILNDDCLLEIFKKLDIQDKLAVQTVCHRWYEINQIYRRELCPHQYEIGRDIASFSQDRQVFEIAKILKFCGHHLRTVSYPYHYEGNFSAQIVNIIAKYCPNIEILNLYNPILDSKDFDTLQKSCVRIKSLSVSGAYSSYLWEIVEFTRKSNALKEIKFERSEFDCQLICDGIYWNVDKIIIEHCKFLGIGHRKSFDKPTSVESMIPLRKLVIRQCRNLLDFDLFFISTLSQFLTHLVISYSQVMDDGLQNIFTRIHLEELVLEGEHKLTDNVFFCDFKPTLTYVGLWNCLEIKGRGVLRLIQGSPRLRRLELFRSTFDYNADFLQKVAHIVEERHNDEELELAIEVANGHRELHTFCSR